MKLACAVLKLADRQAGRSSGEFSDISAECSENEQPLFLFGFGTLALVALEVTGRKGDL